MKYTSIRATVDKIFKFMFTTNNGLTLFRMVQIGRSRRKNIKKLVEKFFLVHITPKWLKTVQINGSSIPTRVRV